MVMIFIITEIYMSIIMLVSIIILSLRKENYKNLMNMMLLLYINSSINKMEIVD
jgi:hypothetical protein